MKAYGEINWLVFKLLQHFVLFQGVSKEFKSKTEETRAHIKQYWSNMEMSFSIDHISWKRWIISDLCDNDVSFQEDSDEHKTLARCSGERIVVYLGRA